MTKAILAIPCLALALSVLACNLLPGIPVTPTLAPTVIVLPSPTVIASSIALVPSKTMTPLPPTATPSATIAPSATFTNTATPAPTETPLVPPTETPIPTATNTPSETPITPTVITPSNTPSITPFLPTRTPQPSPTVPTPTLPRATPSPSPTSQPPTPTSTATLIPQPAFTRAPTLAAVPTLIPTVTFVPQPTLAPTLVPQPTAIPTLVPLPPVTLAALPSPTSAAVGTPIPVAPNTPTALRIGSIPTPSFGFSIDSAGGTLQVSPATTRDADISINGRTAAIDQNGRLFLDGNLAPLPLLQAAQKYTLVRWSPNGRYLAYVLEADNARSGQLDIAQTVDDGLYIYDTQAPIARHGGPQDNPHHVLRNFYKHSDQPPYEFRIVVDVTWAPDSVTMLATVINNVGGFSSVIVGVDTSAADNRPGLFQILPYAGGVWLPDSQGFVSVRSYGSAVLGIVDRNSHQLRQAILDGATVGLWMQNAAQLPDGRFAFLGKPSGNGQLQGGATGLSLYVFTPGGAPIQVSQPLPGVIMQATWNRANTALLVRTQSDQGLLTFVVTPQGGVQEITGRVGGGSIHWR